VPGSGNNDTVPRSLDAGAFVLRKAAVQKYGSTVLSRLANGVARFASGGSVSPDVRAPVKRNRDVAEAQKMMELGLQGARDYAFWLRMHYGAGVDIGFEWGQGQYYGRQADVDRRTLEALAGRSKLSSAEQQEVNTVKQHWRTPMAQPQLWGKDLERDLLDYMEQNQGQFFGRGGVARSDSVPAMLTPGEYVVNRSAVSRFGAGFFEALNNLSMPAQALAQRVQGFASGGLVQSLGLAIDRPVFAADAGPMRTVRVELASGSNKVNATIDARDESRLLQLLEVARARAI